MIEVKQLREWYWREPFVPFALRLKDGRAVAVHDPDLIAFHPHNPRRVSVFQLDDRLEIIDWDQIAEIVPLGGQTERAA